MEVGGLIKQRREIAGTPIKPASSLDIWEPGNSLLGINRGEENTKTPFLPFYNRNVCSGQEK